MGSELRFWALLAAGAALSGCQGTGAPSSGDADGKRGDDVAGGEQGGDVGGDHGGDGGDDGDDGGLCTGEVIGCKDAITLLRCEGGSASELACGGACARAGNNATLGCNEAELACQCTILSGGPPCNETNVGRRVCVTDSASGASDVAECKDGPSVGSDEPMWLLTLCSEVCAARGEAAVGCGAPSVEEPDGRVCLCGKPCVPACGAQQSCNPATGVCETGDCVTELDCPDHWGCINHRCQAVECTNSRHCGYCHRCAGYYCEYCGVGPYGCYCG